jgi:hypothetical protein
MRDRIAKALYDHWVAEDFGNEYCSWELLGDKTTWRERADAVLQAMRSGVTPQMINAGLAWQAHCSDVDSLFEEMINAAQHPEDFPAEMPKLYAA